MYGQTDPVEAPNSFLTPDDLVRALATSAGWLERHVEAINALNVYPVPDGDTGLNMWLTLQSAADQAGSRPHDTVASVAEAAARGSLMGARGNSGVILAQILRGMSESLINLKILDPIRLATALNQGALAAYAAIPTPVEGTILTVARMAGAAAEAAANAGEDIPGVINRAEAAARAAVATTPDLLPILKEAGVVDAGGEGYRVILEGLSKYLRGEPISEGTIRTSGRADLAAIHEHTDGFGYCTEVLFRASQPRHDMVRSRLEEMGTSLLVVGDRELIKVHIHTQRPGAVLDLATELGEILKVKVDNMGIQHEEFASHSAAAGARSVEPGTCTVAVAQGQGFQDLFSSLGSSVVPGGATMNPSVEAIAAAIQRAPRAEVIVLPNHRNVVLAAQEAARLVTERVVAVVPTVSLPQGIAAVLALNPEADLLANLSSVERAADRCHSIEITRAVRDLTLNGVAVSSGTPFALVDGKLAACAPHYGTLVEASLACLPGSAYELATIYTGARGSVVEATAMGETIRARLGLAVDVLVGGEPNYEYIISIE